MRRLPFKRCLTIQRCLTILSLWGLLALATGGCIKRSSRPGASGPELPHEAVSPSGGLTLIDPENLRVSIAATEVSLQDYASNFKVPGFVATFNGNDYIKVLRCQEDYREYLTYMIVQAEGKGGSSREDRKWVWADSFGNPKFCKVASNHSNAAKFSDLGAKNGSFFYVINPCVSAEMSTTGQDECSHRLVLTSTLAYKDSPSQAFQAKAAELADAESEYDATISRLLGLARQMMNEKETCSFQLDQIESHRNVVSAGWDLLSASIFIVGAVAVRGLISRNVMHGLADSLKPAFVNTTHLKNLLKNIGNASNFDKNIYTAGIAGGAYALSNFIRSQTSDRGTGAANASCAKADSLAGQILEIENQKLLELSRKKLVKLSQELQKIEATFSGYTDTSFGYPGEEISPTPPSEGPSSTPPPASQI